MEVTLEDLVEDDSFCKSVEGSDAAGHLEENDTECPEVREGTRQGVLVEHFRRHVQARPNERVRSFCFLDVLEFMRRARVERRAVIFAIVEGLAVPVVDLDKTHTQSLSR